MPITPAFTWEQDDALVRVTVPLKGIARSTVDLYASSVFVKVNFPPYLLGLDLFGPIADHDAKASFVDGSVVLTLPKAKRGAWPSLQIDGLDKVALRARRSESMEKRRAEDEELGMARRQRKQEASDLAFRRQMAIENAEREQLEEKKAGEKAAAEREVYAALAKVQAEAAASKQAASSGGSAASDAGKAAEAEAKAAPQAAAGADDAAAGEASAAGGSARASGEAKAAADTGAAAEQAPGPAVVYLPAPRRAAGTSRVAVRFSGRAFPTPLRQSKKAEEDDWLARNKHLIDARRRATAKDEDGAALGGSIAERDPGWLKAKGDELIAEGDLQGAANAYTAALRADPTHLGSLKNRCVARLRMGHDHAAAVDATTALMLLPTPPMDPAPPLPTARLEELRRQADAAVALAAEAARAKAGGSAKPVHAEAAEVRADRRATIASTETSDEATRLLAAASVDERPALSGATPVGARRGLQRTLARRAAAFLHMGQYARAAADFRCAAECARRDPGSADFSPSSVAASLEGDADGAEALLAAETHKRSADDCLKRGRPADALPHYAAALDAQPGFVPALVNRAAAHAGLGDHEACAADCTEALGVLCVPDADGSVGAAVRAAAEAGRLPAFVPAWGSVRLAAWIKAAAVRRAGARMRVGLPSEAARDFRKAVEMDPMSGKLARDMQQATAAVLVKSGAVRETTMEA